MTEKDKRLIEKPLRMSKPRHKTDTARRAAVRQRLDECRHGVIMGVCHNLRKSVASFFASPSSGKDLIPVDERFSAGKMEAMKAFEMNGEEIDVPKPSVHMNSGLDDGLNVRVGKGVGTDPGQTDKIHHGETA